MKTLLAILMISTSIILTNCKTNLKETRQLEKSIQTKDTNFLGMNYYAFNDIMDIKFYDSLPHVLRQLKPMKDLHIENYSKAEGNSPGRIYLNGKFANLETDRIYLDFPDNIFASAMVDFWFSDSDVKYKILKEALNKKYGKSFEYKKDKGCKWDFSYYVGEEKHDGGSIFLSIVDQIYLVLNYTTEKENYYDVRQKNKAAEKILIDSEKL